MCSGLKEALLPWGAQKSLTKPPRLGGCPDTRGQKRLALVPLAPLTTLVLTLKTFQAYEK